MWFSDGAGDVFLVEPEDGFKWGDPITAEGLEGDPHHVQVIYDENRFGAPDGPRYKIWYWYTTADIYTFQAIGYAESDDGIDWTDGTEQLTQDDKQKLVAGSGNGWNAGTYGPISIIYQPGAANDGTDPFEYSYVLYYDATDGISEITGLAYSKNGLHWTRY